MIRRMRETSESSRVRPPGPQDRPAHGTRLLCGLLAVVTAVALAAGCGGSTGLDDSAGPYAKSAGPPLVVAAVPAPGAAALYVAADGGLFAKAGLDVRIESSVSAADVVPDLVNGSVAVTLGQWTSALAAEAAGIRLKVIAAGNSGGPRLEELVTSSASGITRLSQLRGKTVAVNALAGLPQALSDSVLAADGVPPAAVRYTAVPFPGMPAALAAHRVAAAFMVQPYLEEAGNGVRVLADIDDDSAVRGIPVTGYYSSQAWAGAHAAQLAAFTRALAQGQRTAAADPAAARQAIAKYTGVSAAVAAKMALGAFPASVSAAGLSRVGTLMQRYGLLSDSARIGALVAEMTS